MSGCGQTPDKNNNPNKDPNLTDNSVASDCNLNSFIVSGSNYCRGDQQVCATCLTGNCTSCKVNSGFGFDANNKSCSKCTISHCNSCSANYKTCTGCELGWQINSSGTRTPHCPANLWVSSHDKHCDDVGERSGTYCGVLWPKGVQNWSSKGLTCYTSRPCKHCFMEICTGCKCTVTCTTNNAYDTDLKQVFYDEFNDRENIFLSFCNTPNHLIERYTTDFILAPFPCNPID